MTPAVSVHGKHAFPLLRPPVGFGYASGLLRLNLPVAIEQVSDDMKTTYLLLVSLLCAGCGSAPTAATVAQTLTPTYTVTCPSGTSLVQNTTCEETTSHAAVSQLSAENYCASAIMHLCTVEDRVGQYAKAPQEVTGTSYWLGDVAMGGDGFIVTNGIASGVASGSYPFFCCTEGTVTL